jgi:type IV secretory pathway TraG/TraD family ATPase VirD4
MAELIGLIIFIIVMWTALKYALESMGLLAKKSNFSSRDKNSFTNLNDNYMNLLNPLRVTLEIFKAIFGFLFGGFSNTGMMGFLEKNSFFKSSNRGLVCDGKSSKLSVENSFKHIGIIGGTGMGKTSSFIIPNIIELAKDNNSFIITDIKGELFEKTSGYLQSQGYKIYILDPENLEESIRYNPLYYAIDPSKVDLIVNTLIKSEYPGVIATNEKGWLNGAKTIISILIKVLIRTKQYEFVNLANVKFLLNHFGKDGEHLNKLVAKYADNKTATEWYGFINGNEKTIQSYISTAQMVLNSIGVNDNLEILTATHNFSFEKLREEKSVVYIRVPPHKQEQYGFLLNLFYTQFFNHILENADTKATNQRKPNNSNKPQLPVYCLLDEFGNMSIPNFSKIVTTIRSYRVSISIVLQDFAQLEQQYGRNEAKTILNGGITGKIFFAGADLDITSELEKMMGSKYVEHLDAQGELRTYKEPVMSVRDIRTMQDNEILFIYANKLPIKLKTTPYYKQSNKRAKTNKKPYEVPNLGNDDNFKYIDIFNI